MNVENISLAISGELCDWAGFKLTTPGSAIELATYIYITYTRGVPEICRKVVNSLHLIKMCFGYMKPQHTRVSQK